MGDGKNVKGGESKGSLRKKFLRKPTQKVLVRD